MEVTLGLLVICDRVQLRAVCHLSLLVSLVLEEKIAALCEVLSLPDALGHYVCSFHLPLLTALRTQKETEAERSKVTGQYKRQARVYALVSAGLLPWSLDCVLA